MKTWYLRLITLLYYISAIAHLFALIRIPPLVFLLMPIPNVIAVFLYTKKNPDKTLNKAEWIGLGVLLIVHIFLI